MIRFQNTENWNGIWEVIAHSSVVRDEECVVRCAGELGTGTGNRRGRRRSMSPRIFLMKAEYYALH
jgi:hypothetical protein